MVFCCLLAAGMISESKAQRGAVEALAMGQTQPGFDLLSELTDEVTASKLIDMEEAEGIEIKASRINVDLRSEKEVEFSVRSAWAKDFVWKFGDGSTMSGFRHVKHKFEKPGIYQVTLVASNENVTKKKSIEVRVTDTSEPMELEEMQQYIVFPSDNKLELDIRMNLPRKEKNLQMEVKDISGDVILLQSLGKVKKREVVKIDLQDLEGGKYYAVLKGKKFNLVSKLVVAR